MCPNKGFAGTRMGSSCSRGTSYTQLLAHALLSISCSRAVQGCMHPAGPEYRGDALGSSLYMVPVMVFLRVRITLA